MLEVDIAASKPHAAAIIAMFRVFNWLTPMHSTNALSFSIFLARFSPICVTIAFLPTRSSWFSMAR
jgi:hypothetical protein